MLYNEVPDTDDNVSQTVAPKENYNDIVITAVTQTTATATGLAAGNSVSL